MKNTLLSKTSLLRKKYQKTPLNAKAEIKVSTPWLQISKINKNKG